jgi:predicted ABC-type exoprotein transport system permease subunit
MLLLVIVLLLLFGGGSYYGYSRWVTRGGLGIVGTALLIVVVLYRSARCVDLARLI